MSILASLRPFVLCAAFTMGIVALPSPQTAREPLYRERLPGQPPASHSRLATVDLSGLAAARGKILGGAATKLPLKIFDEWDVVFKRVAKTSSGYALSGRLAGRSLSSVTIVVNGDVVAGTVNSDGVTWHVRSRGTGVVELRKLEGTLRCGVESVAPFAGLTLAEAGTPDPALAKTVADLDDGDEIDVLVVFTEAARRLDGGLAKIRANIDLAVAATNEAYLVSGATQRINLVSAVQIDYLESRTHGPAGLRNQAEDIKRLRDETDGYMDDVPDLRDSYGADIVYLITDQPGGGGVGNVYALQEPDPAAGAFAVSNSLGEYPRFLAHELGHVMGLQHDRYASGAGNYSIDNKPYPYSFGYVNQEAFADGASEEQRWFTIMAYNSQCSDAGLGWCRELMRFSNPNQRYPANGGDRLGVPGDEPSDAVDGPADAVRSLNNTRSIVANFRQRSTRCAYSLSLTEHAVAAGGGSFSIQVDTETRCTWSARVLNGFLSVDSSEPQKGNGDFVYYVMPNQGPARVGYITVAGETLAIFQSGAIATTSVCDRTAAVRDAIGSAANKNACSAVTEFALLEIGSLDLEGKGISALRARDFAGLTNLAELDLSSNQITSLPENIFRDLTSIRKLKLDNNRLVHLPTGIFANLSELRELDLYSNELTVLSDGIFAGLTKLEWLRLWDNKLVSLPHGIFSDLEGLRYLSLWKNQLSGLRKEMFEGPTTLFTLDLSYNPLISLPEDLFSDSDILQLVLRGTQLSEIPPRLFRNLPNLWRLFLGDNQIVTLHPGVFPGGNIEQLVIADNRLQALPEELFLGFTSEFCTRRNMHLDMQGNPGSPFPLELEAVRLDAGPAAEGPASIAIRVAEGAPLPLTVGLSAPGARLSRTETTVPNGSVLSEPIELESDGPVTVHLEGDPDLPATYKGIRIVIGEPLLLFALEDQTLVANGAPFTLDLAAALAPEDGAQTYTVTTTRAEVAGATVEDLTLIVRPVAEGATTVTVTANNEDGSTVVRTFIVTVAPQATPDFDGDGTVGFTDFVQFAASFGLSRGDAGYDARFDLDGDGNVGFSDFLIFAGSFGQGA